MRTRSSVEHNYKFSLSRFQVDAAAVLRARTEEAMALKSGRCLQHADSRQKSKNMREAMREQKQRSRQLIVACARKMQEQEAEIEQV